MPPGIATYVEVSGEIARRRTEGMNEFCALFPTDCEEIAPYIEETPYRPGGFPEVEIGTALVGWDGAGEELVQEGRRPLAGPSGEELWVGRYGFYCIYQYWIGPFYISGPCLTFEGAFTYTVRPDDGAGDLSLAVLSHAAGGPTDLLASTPEGAEVSEIRWHFVPDGGGTIEGPEVAGVSTAQRAGPGANAAAAGAGRWAALKPGSGETWEVESPEELPQGIYFLRPAPGAGGGGGAAMRGTRSVARGGGSRATAVASRVRSLAECDGGLTCSTTVDAEGGTFVVSAKVNGVSRSAEARVQSEAALKLTCSETTVRRGDEIACKLSTIPEGLPIEEPQWKFTGGGVEILASGEQEWGGPMVVGGRMTASARVHGQPAAHTAEITVQPRAWSPLALADETQEQIVACSDLTEYCPLEYPPSIYDHLGVLGRHLTRMEITNSATPVTRGPNTGWSYVAGDVAPFAVSLVVYLNKALFDPKDPFYRYHDGRPQNGRVRRCEVRAYAAIVRDHEYVHERKFRREWNSHWPGAYVEQLTQHGDFAAFQRLLQRWERIYRERVADYGDWQHSNPQDYPSVPGCEMNFEAPYGGKQP